MNRVSKFLKSQTFFGIVSAVVLGALVLVSGAFWSGGPTVEAAMQAINLPAYLAADNASRAQEVEAHVASVEAQTDEVQTIDTQNVEAPVQIAKANTNPVQSTSTQATALSYSGDVFAVDKVPVAVEVVGQVLALNADVGAPVQAGEILLEIDSTTLKAQRAQALAGLQAAEAQLRGLLLDPEESSVKAAEANLAAARASYNRALQGPTREDLNIAESQLRQAEAFVKQAQAAYNEIRWMPQIAMMPQSLQLEQATLQFEAAKAQFEKVQQGSTQDILSGAFAQVAGAEAQLDQLLRGANEPQIDAVKAQVRQAETALLLADIQVSKATVRAPISGVINQVNTSAGANVAPGAPVFEILSNDVKVVISVEESRRGDITVGQSATIRVNAFGERTFAGEVVTIAPALDAATRTFEVTIRPTEDASELAPGMFAKVELGQ